MDPTKGKLIQTVAALCGDLDWLVIAEGVETSRERDTLVGLGCDLLQGYLFGKPAPAMLTTDGTVLDLVVDEEGDELRDRGSRSAAGGAHAVFGIAQSRSGSASFRNRRRVARPAVSLPAITTAEADAQVARSAGSRSGDSESPRTRAHPDRHRHEGGQSSHTQICVELNFATYVPEEHTSPIQLP